MAEDTPAASAPAPDAGESSVERAPADAQPAAAESAQEPSKEKEEQQTNGPEDKPSGKLPPNTTTYPLVAAMSTRV